MLLLDLLLFPVCFPKKKKGISGQYTEENTGNAETHTQQMEGMTETHQTKRKTRRGTRATDILIVSNVRD